MELERNIEQTWQMLRDQSANAAVRAEQTMVEVRDVFHLSHELGEEGRRFGISDADRLNEHDLTAHSDWWDLKDKAERAKNLRDYWRSKLLPQEISLTQESSRVFSSLERELEEPLISSRKKRVFVTTSRDVLAPCSWEFEIPSKSYEVWMLLPWRKVGYWLDCFVIPQKVFSQPFAKAKKSLKKDEKIPVTIREESGRFLLNIHGSDPIDITELCSNYEPLK
jgi:hypothetical protein